MRKLRLLVAVLCASAGGLAATAGSAQAATIVVNPGESIQAAIDSASPGDTILVRPGVYHETVLLYKDRIKLQGSLASIRPPGSSTSLCGWVGICISTGSGYVHGDIVSGFLVSGFDIGILGYGVDHPMIINNNAFDNAEYGITTFVAISPTIANNSAQGSGEAGIYIGDSPTVNASVHDNGGKNNTFGLLYRNANGGSIVHNTFQHNCAGMVIMADAPGPASNVTIQSNTVSGNSNACSSSDLGPISGAGIVLAGADHSLVHNNNVRDNVPSDFTSYQGGIVVVAGPGGTPASFDTISGNTALHNSPDIYWDSLGHGNVFRFNTCQTSVPHGLCP